jgi:PAS domain S-box-containing protein
MLINNIKIKLKLFYPIFLGMLVAIVAISLISVSKVRQSIEQTVVENLNLEVKTVKSMFERERELKLQKVKYEMRVARDLFLEHELGFSNQTTDLNVINQISLSEHHISIPEMLLSGKPVYKNYALVDRITYLSGGTATIFQKMDSGYVRLSTNVQQSDSSRAINTFIPGESPVIQTIEKGETFFGRAYVVNDWYITAYEPIYYNNEIVGILYVGDKEKDIRELRNILQDLSIGESGYVFVLDSDKQLIVEPGNNQYFHETVEILDELVANQSGFSIYTSEKTKAERILAYHYYEDFGFYIGASINRTEVEEQQVRNILFNALLTSLIILIIFSIYVFFITTNRVQTFLNALQESGKKLASAKFALKQSEENFRTLFDNTSDEIFVTGENNRFIFVNQRASDTLGYTQEEFKQMSMEDVKSDRYRKSVAGNRLTVHQNGEAVFDTEHKTKSGEKFPVEIKSRVIEISNQKAILSISRNMSARKEMERKLLSVVIQTEEKERERFSKDMHDGLGPLLSTIKLYVNELEGDDLKKAEKIQYINYVNELLDEAVTSTRTISNNLMPRVIHEYGLVKAVESFCRKVNNTNKIKIEFITEGIEESLDQNIQLILFRVINELINNTLKHARASKVEIYLIRRHSIIQLTFTDNGVGFDVEEVMERKRAGIGLRNIFGRISSINGRSEVNSAPGEGVDIRIEIDM